MKTVFLCLLMVISLVYCSSGDISDGVPDNICRQDPCYPGPFDPPWLSAYDEDLAYVDENGIRMTCDNKVLETGNVLTFSDASSDEIKILYSEMTETALAEIMVLLDIRSGAELGITGRDTKITIYSNRYKNHRQNSKAFGFILDAIDHPNRANPYDPDFLAWYQREVKHETMHVVEYCFTGRKGLTHEWFNEGLAEHVSGGAFPPITTWEEVEEWRAHPDHTNPITINQIFPVDWTRVGEFYPMFRLAVRYLLDPRGLGKNYLNIKAVFQDIGNHTSNFAEAFEIHMGISVNHYAEHFYEWIEEYLNQNPLERQAGNTSGKSGFRKNL